MNDKVPVTCTNLERVPAWPWARLEDEQILMAQLSEEVLDLLDGVRGLARGSHRPARRTGEISERRDLGGSPVGSDDRVRPALMIERVRDRQEINRNIDRAGNRRHLVRRE